MKTLIFDLQLFSGNCQVLDASGNEVYNGDFASATAAFSDNHILEDNYTIKLLENCTTGVRIMFKSNITLDLNGYTVTKDKSTGALFTINNGASVTVKNGTIENNSSSGSAITNYANLYVVNANIIGSKYGILNSNGTVNVTESTVTGGISAFYNTGNIIVNGSDVSESFNYDSKDMLINALDGNDTITSSGRSVTIDAGAGNDTITNSGSRVSINGGEGNDYILNSGAKVTVVASAGNDSIVGMNSSTNIQATVINSKIEGKNIIITTDDGTFTIVDGKNETFILNGKKTVYGSDSGYGNGNDDEVILIGTDSNDTIKDDNGSVFIYGGNGNDTIYGGAGDYIDAGSGANYVSMSTAGKSTLNFAEGKTSVDNFNFADSDKADTIKTGNVSIRNVKVNEGNVILNTAKGYIEVMDAENEVIALENNDYGDDVTNLQVGDQKLLYDGITNKYWAAGKDATVIVGDIGDDVDTVVDVALDNSGEIEFYGSVKDIDARECNGATSLTGDSKNNVIVASAGGSTLNGGKGKNTLQGGALSDTFIVGEGKDLIIDFVAGTSEVSDIINTGDASITAIKTSGDDVIITTEKGKMTVEGGVGEVIQFTNNDNNADDVPPLAVAFGNNFSVADGATFCWATGKRATVSFADYSGSSLVVDLTNTDFKNREKLGFYGDIRAIDAGAYVGAATLSGSGDKNNIITASDGGSSLWGGGSSNDTLIGGDGADVFVYGKGNGNDVIKDADSHDIVELQGITLTDLVDTGDALFSGDDVKVKLVEGGTLTVKDAKNSGVVFEVDGTKYAVDKDSGKWITK